MEQLTAIILDILAVGIVLYCTFSAIRKGFLRTIVQMGAYLAILLVASSVSRTAAPILYDRLIEPVLLERYAPGTGPDNAALVRMAPAARGLALADTDVWSGLNLEAFGLDPDSINLDNLDFSNLTMEDILERLEDAGLSEIPGDLLHQLIQQTIRPGVIRVIEMVGFVILFMVLSMLVNILLGMLGVINHLPLIGGINAALGGIVGLAQGLLLCWLAALLVHTLSGIGTEGWWAFTPGIVDRTYLLHFFLRPTQLGLLF